MTSLADLLQPQDLAATPDPAPDLMTGIVLDTAPLLVKVEEFDGGRTAFRAFGHWPDAAPGDEVKVKVDSRGQFVCVAWEPA